MKTFAGRCAVITGAGSGFGREFAKLAAARQMNLVLADVQADALEAVASSLQADGREVLAHLADAAFDRFGAGGARRRGAHAAHPPDRGTAPAHEHPHADAGRPYRARRNSGTRGDSRQPEDGKPGTTDRGPALSRAARPCRNGRLRAHPDEDGGARLGHHVRAGMR
ncbi:MAG: SDR family NAD(P)-dependent oxidoreductase [Betaproteobacteria bacterium]|nr:SDR family NAD(P)-dependent oxidoreductase [Betaproteobacteria bacterium]